MFLDTIKHYTHSTITKTKFLNLTEQAQLQNYVKDINYSLYGGYEGAELKRAFINTEVSDIICFRILYNQNFLRLSHQNILGSILSLGIDKNTIGDILVEHDCFFVIGELKDYIRQEFTSIGKVSITLEEIQPDFKQVEKKLEEHKMFIDSLRLDLVVSRIAGISRNEAKIMIENDFVKVNHIVCNKPTKELQEEDLLSIRKKGRFVLSDTKKRSKKNKIMCIYHKFV